MKIKQTDVFQKWFDKLRDNSARIKIYRRIELLEKNNYFGDHRTIGGGVSEMRIKYGPGYRLYYTMRENEIVILLCGGDKDSQVRDRALAKELVKEV